MSTNAAHKTSVNAATATELLSLARAWRAEGHGVAIARVLETWGSAPRPVGSVLVIRDDEMFEGSVSGGCIEGEVIFAGLGAIKTGQSKILEFGVSNSDAWQVGLACGGKIKILVEPMDDAWAGIIESLLQSLEQDESATLLTNLVMLETRLSPEKTAPDEAGYFVQTIEVPLEMVIIGAVHIAQALAPMAAQAGFHVRVIDPRGAFALNERFEGIELLEDWPDDVLSANPPHARTAVVTLTHDPKLDDAALKAALASPAFYIGSLGSKKTHAARLERLQREGFDEAALSRIHGPVGLAIGASGAAEIAVSILAEVIATLRQST